MDIQFKRPELSDRETINEYLRKQSSRSCEYTFANIFLWSRHYPMEWGVLENMVIFKTIGGEETMFAFPMGDSSHLKACVDALTRWCQERELPLKFHSVTEEQFRLLEETFPGRFQVEYFRDEADYVYEQEKLAALSGKKYHGKKNHVNKFARLYPDWTYESISEENVEECFQMALKWRNANGCDDDEEKNQEMCVTLNYLRLFKELEMRGGLIRTGGRVVAFSIGEPVGDTMMVHIEKAYADIEGAYTMINQQFVLHEAEGCRYVNREDDTGDEGLRRAKESYHPVFMVQKGIVSERNAQTDRTSGDAAQTGGEAGKHAQTDEE
ncbi:MAG: phosphatidylglycerol lysyltransferase domain-containing protein [Candidatus Limivivens sp.]|nr:phosphatidylglycerol lysyltransferase domain-containing protein [Candidatus Limivivens sp.]